MDKQPRHRKDTPVLIKSFLTAVDRLGAHVDTTRPVDGPNQPKHQRFSAGARTESEMIERGEL